MINGIFNLFGKERPSAFPSHAKRSRLMPGFPSFDPIGLLQLLGSDLQIFGNRPPSAPRTSLNNPTLAPAANSIDNVAQNVLNPSAIVEPTSSSTQQIVEIVDEIGRAAISENPLSVGGTSALTITPALPSPAVAPIAGTPSQAADAITTVQPTAQAAPAKVPAPNFVATLASAAVKSPKFILSLFPLFFWLLYSSKVKYVSNINLNISTSPEKKAYEVTLRKGNQAVNVAFVVAAGKPLRFLQSISKEQEVFSDSFTLFNTAGHSLFNKLLGPFYIFRWKREEHYAKLKINIKEPFINESLTNGPVTASIPISHKEVIHITHCPIRPDAEVPASIKELAAEDASGWNVRNLNIDVTPATNITGNRTNHIILPSVENPEKPSSDEYLRIEQQNVIE